MNTYETIDTNILEVYETISNDFKEFNESKCTIGEYDFIDSVGLFLASKY